jgi:hypothetical protein
MYLFGNKAYILVVTLDTDINLGHIVADFFVKAEESVVRKF